MALDHLNCGQGRGSPPANAAYVRAWKFFPGIGCSHSSPFRARRGCCRFCFAKCGSGRLLERRGFLLLRCHGSTPSSSFPYEVADVVRPISFGFRVSAEARARGHTSTTGSRASCGPEARYRGSGARGPCCRQAPLADLTAGGCARCPPPGMARSPHLTRRASQQVVASAPGAALLRHARPREAFTRRLNAPEGYVGTRRAEDDVARSA
jgi:hypothetical protein